ncbi:Retrovirus-related Pol polyprotein from transposon 17.6, partial [Mucuna pruriens]
MADGQDFKDVMRIDMEAYVDDTVVKSTMAEEHCNALQRVFEILRKHQLKLNPKKCSFGVQAEKIQGFMLTKRGIEANPEKCQGISDMRSPQNVKEIEESKEAFQKMKAMLAAHLFLRGRS